MTKTTLELVPGDVLRIDGRLTRTVLEVRPNGYLNYRNETLYTVWYLEGDTPEWSAGNSGAPATEWQLEPFESSLLREYVGRLAT